ncbi:MAG: metal-dependent hydrolase [Nitrososphaeria archaeon]|jgi:L-ascorbate metabolism protein UlaG (beta-lactamase superfamily)|nr:metal-dependent hydrolase [Nitrososphaerota archaeon]
MEQVKIRWLGHAAFEIQGQGSDILIDPWLTNPLSPVRPEEVKPDYIVVTHDHNDHLGEAIEISKRTGAPIISVYELANYISEKGGKSIGMNIGGPLVLKNNLYVYLTQAFHSSTHGSPTGAIININGLSIYHAGDTGLFGDMKLIGEVYSPDVALLPIGGFFTMNPEQAAVAVQLISPRYAIPMHYNTFDIIKQDPSIFAEKVKKLRPSTEVLILKPGESRDLS